MSPIVKFPKCNDLCKLTYWFSREMDLCQAIEQGIAITLERDSIITGYAAGVGIFSHAVAKLKNEDIKLLISIASSIQGSGFLHLLETMN